MRGRKNGMFEKAELIKFSKQIKRLFGKWEIDGHTQKDFAVLFSYLSGEKVSQSQVSKWKNGISAPSDRVLYAICAKFGVPTSSFYFTREDVYADPEIHDLFRGHEDVLIFVPTKKEFEDIELRLAYEESKEA